MWGEYIMSDLATRTDYAYYSKLWQKSLLIEIYDTKSRRVVKSFAFSVPPESMQIEIPQRVSVRKTFGGVYVDDYGIDTLQITFKGTTGNSQFKEIYRDGRTTYVDGKDEAEYVIEEIMQYKNIIPVNREDIELRLYDLSSLASNNLTPDYANLRGIVVRGWKVVLKESGISRSKERPFHFDYNFEFLGISPLGYRRIPTEVSAFSRGKFLDSVFAAIETLKEKGKGLREALAKYKEVIGYLDLVNELTVTFQSALRGYYRTIQGFVNTTLDGVNSVIDIVTCPLDLAEDLANAMYTFRASIESGWDAIVNGIADTQDRAIALKDLVVDIFTFEQASAEIMKELKANSMMPEAHLVPVTTPGAQRALSANDSSQVLDIAVLLTYGHQEVVATSETRLDALSSQMYGTPEYADIIAKANGFASEEDIQIGMVIKVPNLVPPSPSNMTEIYGPETYGTDITLGPNGDMVLAEFNDYATVTGMQNIQQAILLRLSESQGSRVRLDVYGIRDSGGGYDTFALAMLVTSIRDTLVQDPRVVNATNFRIQTIGDKTYLDFSVELISGVFAPITIGI